MNILFITLSDINICSSSNIRNVSLIKGLLDDGNSVDIITYRSGSKAIVADDSFSPVVSQCGVMEITGSLASEKISSGLLSSSGGGIKKTVYNKLRKLYYSLEPVDSFRKIALTVNIDALDIKNNAYDLIISSSNPYSVHVLAKRIIDKYFPNGIRWFQYWGDALYFDTLTRHPLLPYRLKKAEKGLISGCDKIIYTNGVVLELQKQLFKGLADKMTFIETPFAFSEPSKSTSYEYQAGYFGSYSSLVRDIVPLHSVLQGLSAQSVIIGNGDPAIEGNSSLTVLPRATVNTVKEYEAKTRVLICVCNKAAKGGAETGLIPGKAYHYGATDKEVLIVGATPRVKEFLAKYNRFIFVDNNDKDIKEALTDILSHNAESKQPLKETTPQYAAGKIQELFNEQ